MELRHATTNDGPGTQERPQSKPINKLYQKILSFAASDFGDLEGDVTTVIRAPLADKAYTLNTIKEEVRPTIQRAIFQKIHTIITADLCPKGIGTQVVRQEARAQDSGEPSQVCWRCAARFSQESDDYGHRQYDC